jgi:hypothetical protein
VAIKVAQCERFLAKPHARQNLPAGEQALPGRSRGTARAFSANALI